MLWCYPCSFDYPVFTNQSRVSVLGGYTCEPGGQWGGKGAHQRMRIHYVRRKRCVSMRTCAQVPISGTTSRPTIRWFVGIYVVLHRETAWLVCWCFCVCRCLFVGGDARPLLLSPFKTEKRLRNQEKVHVSLTIHSVVTH